MINHTKYLRMRLHRSCWKWEKSLLVKPNTWYFCDKARCVIPVSTSELFWVIELPSLVSSPSMLEYVTGYHWCFFKETYRLPQTRKVLVYRWHQGSSLFLYFFISYSLLGCTYIQTGVNSNDYLLIEIVWIIWSYKICI